MAEITDAVYSARELAMSRMQAQATKLHASGIVDVSIDMKFASGPTLTFTALGTAIATGTERLNGQGRLIVRPSGTEPVIRVTGEGDDSSLVEEVVDGVVDALTQVAAA